MDSAKRDEAVAMLDKRGKKGTGRGIACLARIAAFGPDGAKDEQQVALARARCRFQAPATSATRQPWLSSSATKPACLASRAQGHSNTKLRAPCSTIHRLPPASRYVARLQKLTGPATLPAEAMFVQIGSLSLDPSSLEPSSSS
ncbi:hypothetical protein CDD81_4458 [Ophiocordyceps australis]|uniref:Uncharacterized protein n=1 Tax=Ophiocordyceps australis TaxID=1399860 RepID=A0A2C5YHG6_9HYPO|nr:hypothetical protein CDD81_4458 [Ophiocordyceps australis]